MGRHPNVINEEAIYVLDGKGVLRIEGEEVEIKKGDYITFPAGKAAQHQAVLRKNARYTNIYGMIQR